MRRFVLILIAALFSSVVLCAQESRQNSRQVSVYFRAGSASIDLLWNGNDRTVPSFMAQLRADLKTPAVKIDEIVVLAYTSPEGKRNVNERLSQQRLDAVESYLRTSVLGLGNVSAFSVGEDWFGLSDYLESHPDIPQAGLIRKTIAQTPVVVRDDAGRAVSSRKKEVMDVLSEQEWNDMKVSVFPALRRVDVFVFYAGMPAEKEPLDKSVREEPQQEPQQEQEPVREPEPERLRYGPGSASTGEEIIEQAVPVVARSYASTAVVGTNVLLNALTIPNISMEFPFGRHWSAGGSVLFPAWPNWQPWWRTDVERFSLAQAILAGAQLSYYFIPWNENDSRVLRGPYVRAFGYGGPYSFERRESKETGVLDQGYYFSTGLSVGAAIPMGAWLRLDVSAGFGPSWTRNTHNVNYDIQGKPIPVDFSTTLRWKAADAQVGVKYIFHKSKKF